MLMRDDYEPRVSPKAVRECADALREFLRIGWPKSSLDFLEELWWTVRDPQTGKVREANQLKVGAPMSDTRRDQFRELTNMVAEDGKGRQMSDTRREILERNCQAQPETFARKIESAMSEYATAVLEEMRAEIRCMKISGADNLMEILCRSGDLLRARATQERTR